MMNVKVLGGGCSKCETLLANTKEAVANSGIEAEVEYVTDFAVIASYGIMSTPALMVDEKIVSMGKVLKSSDIEKYLNAIETLEYYERNLQKENINIKRMAFDLFYNRHYKDCKIIIFERKLDLTEAVRMKKDYIEKIEPIFN